MDEKDLNYIIIKKIIDNPNTWFDKSTLYYKIKEDYKELNTFTYLLLWDKLLLNTNIFNVRRLNDIDYITDKKNNNFESLLNKDSSNDDEINESYFYLFIFLLIIAYLLFIK